MDQQTVLKVLPIALGSLALVVALVAHGRFSSARRSLKLLQGSFDGKTLLDAVASYADEVRATQQDLLEMGARQDDLFAALGLSARNLSVVRYDAFEEMGGRLSFSVAVLDDHGTGLVLSSINGRSESRVYAKEVQQGASEHTLSPEEKQAIDEALGHKRKIKERR